MKRFMFAVCMIVVTACTGSTVNEPRQCWLEWMGPEVEKTCEAKVEISRNHLILWVTIEGGQHVVAVFNGLFPDDLSQPISTLGSYVAMENPSGDQCSNEGEDSQPPGEFILRFNEDDDRTQIKFDAYVTCDGVGWRYLRLVVDGVDVSWTGE